MCGRVLVIAVLASLTVPSVAVEIVVVDASAQFAPSLVRTKVAEAASAANAGAVEAGKEGVALVAVDASAQLEQSMVKKKVDEAARAVTSASAVSAGAAETGNEDFSWPRWAQGPRGIGLFGSVPYYKKWYVSVPYPSVRGILD